MMLTDAFEMFLSTARAGCGLGLVLISVAVGRWAYANPQPTWKDVWHGMPYALRGLSTLMVLLFMTSHAVLTYREYFVNPPEAGRTVKRHIPQPSADPMEMEAVIRGESPTDGQGLEQAAVGSRE